MRLGKAEDRAWRETGGLLQRIVGAVVAPTEERVAWRCCFGEEVNVGGQLTSSFASRGNGGAFSNTRVKLNE